MVFSSLNFLLIFLPIVLLLHSVLPFKYKNIVLLAASIIFYAWGEPKYVLLMAVSILCGYGLGRACICHSYDPEHRLQLHVRSRPWRA